MGIFDIYYKRTTSNTKPCFSNKVQVKKNNAPINAFYI